MPKVPAEHLAVRRRQILDAAMALFAQNGFHATSMQQIITASGMSAGAVYHYFPTKKSLVQATGEAVQATYSSPLAGLATDPTPSPAQVVETLCRTMEEIHSGPVDFTRIGIFMWAEALRDPEALAALQAVQQSLRSALLPLVVRWGEAGLVPEDVGPDAVVAAVYGLVPGFTLQLNTLSDVDSASYARAATALGWRS